MTKRYTYSEKQNGSSLSAAEWNNLAQDVSNAVDAINNGAVSGGSSAIDTAGVVSVNSKGNTTISSSKHVNIEPVYDQTGSENGTYGDVQIKPGDDITLESHHRSESKKDEITVKTSNGLSGNEKAPVKLQVIASDMTLSTKGKKEDSNVMNINVTTGEGKGYLKVRAQAIDLRCEQHGGIALQPKGEDGQGNQNKIKFEHGGGDGLEFGTFNTEKTSIFTDEYRFNRDGVWKMATRQKEVSDKAREDDSTTAYKYVKQADDFYDIILQDDEQCTTKDIIKTGYAMNGYPTVHTKITNKGALEIATETKWQLTELTLVQGDESFLSNLVVGKYYDGGDMLDQLWDSDLTRDLVALADNAEYTYTSQSGSVAKFVKHEAKDIKIDSGAGLKLGGVLDFGSSFNFGETDKGIEFQHKYTKKANEKNCDTIKVIATNNHATQDYTCNTLVNNQWDDDEEEWTYTIQPEGQITVPAGQSRVIAMASMYDIIKLVNYMKTNNQGPWAAA